MVNLTIDNINVSVPEGTTIMDAAKMADIPIPKLCYLKDINEIAACRVCVVELEGMERLVTSCNNVVKEVAVTESVFSEVFGQNVVELSPNGSGALSSGVIDFLEEEGTDCVDDVLKMLLKN